jgi:hypothetical protein
MDTDLLHLLANMGGLGVLAGILFYLHVMGMKTFREELAAERRQCHEDHLTIQQAIRTQAETLVRLVELLRERPESCQSFGRAGQPWKGLSASKFSKRMNSFT